MCEALLDDVDATVSITLATENKLNCLQCVGFIVHHESHQFASSLHFPLFFNHRFICVCINNMALKQRKNFRLHVINYIVVRASEGEEERELFWFGKTRRKKHRNYVVKGNIRLSKNIFEQRSPSVQDNKLTAVKSLLSFFAVIASSLRKLLSRLFLVPAHS